MSKANSIESHPEGKVAIRINVVRKRAMLSVRADYVLSSLHLPHTLRSAEPLYAGLHHLYRPSPGWLTFGRRGIRSTLDTGLPGLYSSKANGGRRSAREF